VVQTVAHLSEAELEAEYVACSDVCRSRHLQTIRLLAKGHSIAEVSTITAYGERWIEQLRARYNAGGLQSLGDQRRGNGTTATILTETVLTKLRERLQTSPDDGGLWSSRKVAAWMAGELGLAKVATQRGWEALKAVGWSIQKPRPKNPKSASPDEAEAFKKSSPRLSPRRPCAIRIGRSSYSPPTSIGSA
jgi:transposase